ncbi:hypothetical protein EGR_07100 [Echinococcus granulosus]|uniref:Uncharacterized protein n=1 Tax=Echinococcus granulosus TaxID=6210 RepID=W6UAH9_ECHGR|nr:hypothetical protein EGR_07100 [Echinococcus granulosus]EUB58080.1 hypothetical protein EGR_07100 [Echinococcus granulosus]
MKNKNKNIDVKTDKIFRADVVCFSTTLTKLSCKHTKRRKLTNVYHNEVKEKKIKLSKWCKTQKARIVIRGYFKCLKKALVLLSLIISAQGKNNGEV